QHDGGLDALELTERITALGTIVHGELHVPDFDAAAGWTDVPVRWRVQIASPLTEEEFRERLNLPRLESNTPSSAEGNEGQADLVAGRPPETAPRQPEAEAPPQAELSPKTPMADRESVPQVPGAPGESQGEVEVCPRTEPGVVAATAAADRATTTAARSDTIRIPVQLVDRLMTLAGELVLVRNQTRRFVDSNQPLPGPVRQRLEAVTSELQTVVLQTRMQPVSKLFGKFPRLVRDLARQFGKQIELQVAGSEVELDKTILDAISDPLMHLVRNACDHGMEMPDERRATGKPAEGTIQLTARHLGDQISIEVQDDGRGIDREAIRQQALRQRIRTEEELARLDDRELLALILLPGFSTAKQLTDISGRGVGMDVVKTNISHVGGSLEITSVAGQGTTIALRLPLTLAIIPGLLVTACGQRYAIPQKEVEELVYIRPGQSHVRIERAADQTFLRLRGRLLPLVRLATVLRNPASLASATQTSLPVEASDETTALITCAVVRAGSRRFGLVVDSVLTSEEIVVKPMHSSLRRLAIYSGVTILGDGQVALILGCDGIARHAALRFGEDAEVRATETTSANARAQRVLLLRDGPEEQFAVPLALLRRVVMVSRERIERIGPQEFVTLDGESTRLLRLRSLLPVSSAAETQVAYAVIPRGVDRPVAMLVREILDTVDAAVELQPTAVTTPGVLGTSVIRGRMTLFLDLATLAGRACKVNSPSIPTTAPAPGARILVVDDTQLFRELVKSYLEAAGYEAVTATDGQQGLELLSRQTFDLVVSDLEMPVTNGWDFARLVRGQPAHRNLPLVALTTLSSDEDRQKALAAGFDGFQVKLDRVSLLENIARLLSSRSTQHSVGVTAHV
ncbi:MAG: chemotaxis protein CheW, partial [Pirellulaceae bacterium]